jgi:drug/metabolite transporter (DMT)-like permease
MKNQQKAYLFGIATVLLWSTVASAFKLSMRYLDHVQLLLYSTIVSIVVLSGILLVQGRFATIFSYTRQQYLQSLKLGFVSPFFYYLVLFKAYDLLPAQVAQPINYTWALTLAFLSIPLLKQRIGMKEIIAGLICYSGVFIISTHGDLGNLRASNPLGVALALGSTVVWSLYWIYNTKDNRDPVASLLLNFLFGLPFIFLYCLIFSDIRVTSIKGLFGAADVGVFEMGITFVLWLNALRLSENTAKVGYLIFLSPFVSLVFIHIFVGEDIMKSTFIGLVFIITGLIIQQLRTSPGR